MTTVATPSTLKIRLFGPCTVQVNGKPLSTLRTRKGLWLLALLALRHDQDVQRSWLIGMLWPDSPESQGYYNLRRSLSDLRHALGEAARHIQSPSLTTLRLHAEGCDLDIIAFESALRSEEEQNLERATELYVGPLLQDCAEPWVGAERRAQEQAYLEAREKLAALALERGEEGRAIHHLQYVLKVTPLRETALRKILQIQARRGEFASALQTYRDFRLRLAREMNAQPDPETVALFRQIRREAQQNTTFARSENASNAPGTSHLPQHWTLFVGREDDVDQIESLLERTRLLTLTGTGGVGKTRLALRAVEELAANYPEGVWFVDLSTLASPELILPTLAAALEIREMPGLGLRQTLINFLRPKRLLLLLDNCEHLLAACVQTVSDLLQHCPRLCLLTTSRQPLGIAGEAVYRVPSLPLPSRESLRAPQLDPDRLVQESAALALFVDRATLSLPTFRLTSQNAGDTANICERLDGIPLAIELVASRVRGVDVAQIAARLEENFRLFTSGGPDRLPRHQTLQAVMEWSYNLLTEPERTLLCRLSVFPARFTLEAAEQVCSAEGKSEDATVPSSLFPLPSSEVLELLLQLLDRSLLLYEERYGEGRYRLLETIRHYAQQKLVASGEENQVQERFKDYYLAMAEEAVSNLSGKQQAQWLERLDRERDHFRELLRRCDAESALRVCVSLWVFWLIRSYFIEGRAWLEQALRRNPEVTKLRGSALYGVGNLNALLGDHARSMEYLKEALSVQTAVGDQRGAAQTLNSLGGVAQEQGDYQAARAWLEQCTALMKELDDIRGLAHAMANLGAVALAQGDYVCAQKLYEQSVPLLRAHAAEQSLALCLNNLAIIALHQGRCSDARMYHQQGLDILERLGDRNGIAIALSNLARVSTREGDHAMAQEQFRQALILMKELENRIGIAYALAGIAELAVFLGDLIRAAHLFGASEALREAIHFPIPPVERESYDRNVASARTSLGEIAFAAAWRAGWEMDLEKAMELALSPP